MNNIVVVGASKGIGAETVNYLSGSGNRVYGVSRTISANCQWIEGDVSTVEGIDKIVEKFASVQIDVLIFCAGIWEENGFMPDFCFDATKDTETRNIMSVNVVAPIELTKKLASNMRLSENPRAIYLGALSGLDNLASSQVAYSASKFALRGAIQAFRVALQKMKIGFTVINLGNVATEEVLLDIEEGRFNQREPIPMVDVMSAISFVLNVTPDTEIGEINLLQKAR